MSRSNRQQHRKACIRPTDADFGGVFRYWDGTKEIGFDLIELTTKFQSAIFDPEFQVSFDLATQFQTKVEQAKSDEELQSLTADGIKATQQVVTTARQVFGLKPFVEIDGEPEGVPDTYVLRVLHEFIAHITELKKNIDSPQTLQQSTE